MKPKQRRKQMNDKEIQELQKEIKEGKEITLHLDNGNVQKSITVDTIQIMPKYGNPPDKPNLVEFGDKNERLQSYRVDASIIKSASIAKEK